MIVKAVADALAHGRSVLIASHTHVAVDNVVKDVVDIVDKAGDVVRVGSPTKIDPAVVEHDWLMLDKAAAVITRRDARLREIHSRRSINAEDPARQQLAKVADELDEWDLESVDACYDARELAREANQLLERSAEYGKANLVRDSQISSLATRVETEQRAASELSSLARAGERAERERVEIDRAIHRMTLRSNDVRSAQQTLARRLVEIEDERRGWRARMPAKRKLIEQQFAETITTTAALAEEGAALERELAGLRDRSSLAQAAAGLIAARNATARAAQQRAATLNDQIATLRADNATNNRRQRELVRRADDLRARADEAGAYEEFLAQVEEEGLPALRAEFELLDTLVARLDQERDDLDKEERRLADEYADTTRQLLETAPVIACTLAALTTKPELASRRFDTVIIDEAASAEIPYLVYAGAKADRCLAYVGDFLQNSPISDTADAVTEDEQRTQRWQRDDIFSLVGIRDRATAENHSRCVALSTQYRFPPVIADLVNSFCYDGLLDTEWGGTVDGPVITFVDTADHPGQGLRRVGKSWVHPLGLELMESLYQRRISGGSTGLVCPYTAHALKADAISRDRDYDLPCGTSHRFQGRQFDTVILDLMQDSARLRWAAQADLAGSAREVSAAKLLNVAVTRAKRRLFIVGDWSVVRRTRTPGMTAIAALRERREFELTTAAEILGRM